MGLRQFDPKDFSMVLAGRVIDETDTNFFSVLQDTPRYSTVRGIDGDYARVRSKLRGGTITLGLLQSSITNEFLSSISLLDEVTGLLVLPFLAREKGRFGTTVLAPSCFIEMMPNVNMSTGHNTRNWVLRTDNLIQYVGSHDRIDGSPENAWSYPYGGGLSNGPINQS